MKRFHVNISVSDLAVSTRFYSTLFGTEPGVVKDDYVKWMLDDPRINFSLSASSGGNGINHVGIQADTMPELEQIQQRLAQAGMQTYDQPQAECCYANSSKTWIRDPDNVAWETFVTHSASTVYGDDRLPSDLRPASGKQNAACCRSDDDQCCATG